MLERLLREAAIASPGMIEQEYNIARRDAFRFRNWRQHMPFIQASYQLGQFKLIRGENRGNDDRFSGTYSVSARYPLFHWGAYAAEKESALLREKSARQSATLAWRQLANRIRSDFYRAVILKGEINVQGKQLALESARQKNANALFEIGEISVIDHSSRAIAMRDREIALSKRKIELATLIANIQATTGVEKFSIDEIPNSVSSPKMDCKLLEQQLSAFRQTAGESSGEVANARTEISILDEEITRTRAQMLPNLNLGASISQNPYQTNSNRFEMQTVLFAGLTGSWNIFDRDVTNTTVRALKTQQRLIEAQLRARQIARFNLLDAQLKQIRISLENLALRQQYLASAENNLARAHRELKLGIGTEFNVAVNETQAAAARQAIATEQINITLAYYQFLSGIEQDPADILYTAPNND